MYKIIDLMFLFFLAGSISGDIYHDYLKEEYLEGKHVKAPERVWRKYCAESNKDM